MTSLFLNSFYTCKVMPWPDITPGQREVGSPETAIEQQIQAHITQAHVYFFKAQYQQALQEYLTAWGLLPRVVFPFFPVDYARLQPEILFKMDLNETFLEASVSLLQVRGGGVIDPLPYLPIEKIPPSLQEVTAKFGLMGVTSIPDQDELMYNRALLQARTGRFEQALSLFQNAGKLTEDEELKAAAGSAAAIVMTQMGQHDQAIEIMQEALKNYQRVGNQEGMGTIHNNLALIYQQKGDAQQAGQQLQQAAELTPVTLNRTVVQLLNQGISTSLIRPMGTAGLSYILRGIEGRSSWMTFSPTVRPTTDRDQIGILVNQQVISLPLSANGLQLLRQNIYEQRVSASTLSALRTFEEVSVIQFVTYLTHVWGFVLPVALGDTYYELGEYEMALTYYTLARNYQYLNLAIEMPNLWRRMAQTYLDYGQLLYKQQNTTAAQAQLEHIVKIDGNNFVLAGPLYSGAFSSMTQLVQAFLNAADRVNFPGLSYDIRSVILEALTDLRRILAHINWLGFPDDIIPIQSFQYLQNVARYFADNAIQAERTFISFKTRQEEAAANRQMLEDAVAQEQASLALEAKRVEAAQAQRDAAQANADLSQLRVDNANATLNDYATVSWQLQELDASIALANAAANDTEIEVTPGRAAQLGVEAGTYEARYYIKLLTQRRNQVNRDFEKRNMQRQRDELVAAKAAADAQVQVGNVMVDIANAQKEVVQIRLENARARLENFSEQMFTPELWDNLAREMRQIARQYLRWAIGAAFLMQRAFEFEHDRPVQRIRFDYERSELAGLLAADFLKRDIDSFIYEELLETQKKIPMKEMISLSERYPFQFYRQFQKTGHVDFETRLIDFDRRYPGSYQQKIKRIEVVVDGLVPPEGLHGTLTNSGTSHYRDRQGQRLLRLQKPETLLLSRFTPREDSLILTPQQDMLQLFENTGVATGWVLEVPPEQNDIDYQAIVDIKLVIYYETFFSEDVAAVVKAELAAEPKTYSIGFGLAYEFPEAFFELQNTGEVVFTLDGTTLPYYQTDPHITDMTVILQTQEGAPVNNIELKVQTTTGGVTATDRTDTSGQIAANPGGTAPLNQFLNQSLLDTWHIVIDKNANAAAFASGFSWAKVSNIFFWVEYSFTPRTL